MTLHSLHVNLTKYQHHVNQVIKGIIVVTFAGLILHGSFQFTTHYLSASAVVEQAKKETMLAIADREEVLTILTRVSNGTIAVVEPGTKYGRVMEPNWKVVEIVSEPAKVFRRVQVAELKLPNIKPTGEKFTRRNRPLIGE